MDKRQEVQALIDRLLPQTISDDYRTPELLEENEYTTLGIAVSVWSEWSGDRIMEVFAEALDDANFHTEAREVRKWIELCSDDNAFRIYWQKLQGAN